MKLENTKMQNIILWIKKAHIATQTASGCTECGYKETEICQELDGNKDFNYIYKLYFYIKNILNQNVKYLH